MSYGNPQALLDDAREQCTPEQWAEFESEFAHFCAYSGLTHDQLGVFLSMVQAWSKWAMWKGKHGSLAFDKREG